MAITTSTSSSIGLERTRYFARQRVGPEDLTQDQLYYSDRLRRHNRFLHGWGIGCGMVVTNCGDEQGNPDACQVKVSAGYGLDPYGNELFVPTDIVVDLCHELDGGGLACPPAADPWCGPVNTIRAGDVSYLAIRHVETPVKPVKGPTGCSCSDSACEYSRIRDGYEFTLLDALPSHYDWPCVDPDRLCDAADTCWPCPDSGWVVISTIRFGDNDAPLLGGGDRRYLLSLQKVCTHCDEGDGRDQVAWHRAELTLVGVAATQPDATLEVPLYYDGRPAKAVLAVKAAEVAGLTAADLKAKWDDIPLIASAADVEGGQSAHGLNAGMLLAASGLRGASVIDDLADLKTRIGRPVIAPTEYKAVLGTVAELLDSTGMGSFRENGLANPARLGELDVEALSAVSTINARRLRDAGINTLSDLHRAKRVPELSSAAAAVVERARALMDRLAVTDAGGRLRGR